MPGNNFVTIRELAEYSGASYGMVRQRIYWARKSGELTAWRRSGGVILVDKEEALPIAMRRDGRGRSPLKKVTNRGEFSADQRAMIPITQLLEEINIAENTLRHRIRRAELSGELDGKLARYGGIILIERRTGYKIARMPDGRGRPKKK